MEQGNREGYPYGANYFIERCVTVALERPGAFFLVLCNTTTKTGV